MSEKKEEKEREYTFQYPQPGNAPKVVKVKESDLTREQIHDMYIQLLKTVDQFPQRVKDIYYEDIGRMLEAEKPDAPPPPPEPESKIVTADGIPFSYVKGEA